MMMMGVRGCLQPLEREYIALYPLFAEPRVGIHLSKQPHPENKETRDDWQILGHGEGGEGWRGQGEV